MFDDNGAMSTHLTNRIMSSMDRRTSLKDNETDLMICLLKIHGKLDLKSRRPLTKNEERLLGQLSAVAFRDTDVISVRHYPRAMPIKIARMPRHRKGKEEGANRRLQLARIKTGKKWLGHLPETFSDELVAELFAGLPSERAAPAVKKYCNEHLRLDATDSARLKGFSGLNDTQYVKFSRVLFYLTGLRLLAPIKDVRSQRAAERKNDYKSMKRTVVAMTRVTKKNGSHISRNIHVGVMTVSPFECILTSAGALLEHGRLLPSSKRFHYPFKKPDNIHDVILWKFSADKGGGSWKLIMNPVNIKHPQSLRHVRVICEFSACDTRENLTAGFFNESSSGCKEVEDVVHRRCVLLEVTVNGKKQVAMVRNTNPRHVRHNPQQLTNNYEVRRYTPLSANETTTGESASDFAASVDFKTVYSVVFMYNVTKEQFDELLFVSSTGTTLSKFTLRIPISVSFNSNTSFSVLQYQLAGVFTGDLDFLANFVGHQGASAKWLCLFCLANQDNLVDTFHLGGNAPRFQQRKGVNSIQKCFEIYKREYLDLDCNLRTKSRRERVTQELTYSIVGAPLANIPLDVITPATMHVILGFTKKIYEWLVKLFSQLEYLEEQNTKGRTAHQFRQAITEAHDHARAYNDFLINEFKGAVDAIENKKAETMKLMTEVEKANKSIAKAKIGKRQAALVRKLRVLKAEIKRNELTPEELDFYKQFVAQVSITQQTSDHLKDLLSLHNGDAERELINALVANHVDIDAYHGGSIVGNHCMNMAQNGDKIMDDMATAMDPKIRTPTVKTYLEATSVQVKKILKLWFEIMKIMKSTACQSDAACATFKEHITQLNKEIHSLITDSPVPGCNLKHSKQLKSHFLFDWHIYDFLMRWRTLGGVDEQNIEGVHPQFNQLVRKFGNTRGGRRQELVMNEFVFSHSTWLAETIDEMIEKTSRKKKTKGASVVTSGVSTQETVDRVLDARVAINPGLDVNDDLEAGGENKLGGAEGGADEEAAVRRSVGIDEEEGASMPAAASLADVEIRINNNPAFHGINDLDTRVHSCDICNRRLLQFAMAVHRHETHEVLVEDKGDVIRP